MKIDWEKITDDELIEYRLCELNLKIEGSDIEKLIEQVYKELDDKGMRFHPACYLADEWLCPEGEPVIGIPFYLANSRLTNLEKKMMLEAEGSDKKDFLKLLRHEVGHALTYAYKLQGKKKYRLTFGPNGKEFNDYYRPRPYSKKFVRNLENWYAQAHPDEDFAETFAIWLDPNSDWKNRYKSWKALDKLRFVDDLIKKIATQNPQKEKGENLWAAQKLKTKLKTYYKRKKNFYITDYPDFYDPDLKKIFSESMENKKNESALKFLRRYRKTILLNVSMWTGENKFTINRLIRTLAERCRELDLRVTNDENDILLKITSYVATLIANYMYTAKIMTPLSAKRFHLKKS